MEEITLLDLVYSDTFCEIQLYLGIKDLFNLRCVSTEFLDYIDKELPKLKKLHLPALDEAAVMPMKVLCEKCKSLDTINLSRNEWLRDELLWPLLSGNAETLVVLNLSDCPFITAVAMQPVIINCSKLKKLNLSSCDWLTIGCLEAIAFHQTQLEHLDLSFCKMISERTLIILVNNLRNLKVLSLAAVNNVNDNVLCMISKNQTEIVHLNLFNCSEISDRGIGALSLNCKKLETLSIRGCSLITERSVALLRDRNVHVDIPRNDTSGRAFINQFQRLNRLNYLYLQV